MKFSDLPLSPLLLKSVQEQGYESPTDIQAQAIPYLLEAQNDFVGQAQTGTGKTAAFVLPLLQRLDPGMDHIQALILAPTRELANQIQEEVSKLGKYTGIKSLAVYGGSSYADQKRSLKKDRPQIIIGTPGRILDLMDQGTLDFSEADYLVLDEADEMLNMGFLEDVQTILSSFPERKLIWMFSATMSPSILDLIDENFKSPEILSVKRPTLSNEDIEQRYYLVKQRYHQEALCRLLDAEPDMYGLIFCRTRKETKDLYEALLSRGHQADALHGEMGQNERDAAMTKFKSKKVRLMICTDVAARGIDVNNLTHVINFGLPNDLESYVHRIGRTGRAGMKGVAIALVDPANAFKIKRLEKFTKQKIELARLPSVEFLKILKVQKEIKEMASVIQAVKDKGEEYKLDPSFEIFKQELQGLSSNDLLKVMFTKSLNKELRRYDDLSIIEEMPKQQGRGLKEPGLGKKGSRRGERIQSEDAVRLFANVGMTDGYRLKSLLTEMAKQMGVSKDLIQNMDVRDRFSFMDVPTHLAQNVLKNGVVLKGRKVRFEYSRPVGSGEAPSRSKRQYGRKSK